MVTSKQVYEAVSRLKSEEMRAFLTWMKAERMETLEKLTTAPESSLQKLQGRAQCLAQILSMVEDAPEMVVKLSVSSSTAPG